LTCILKIDYYDEILLPLLHRMSKLEELRLYLKCSRRASFIDGNNLKANIIYFLPRLKKFAFVICSMIIDYKKMNLLTNEDIQNTFGGFPNKNINSYVDYFPNKNESQCYVYSFPFTLTSYERITNNFPGGLFTFVRKISLFDERAFEHDFFRRIQKSFPFMEGLTVVNWHAQNKKLQNVNEYSTLIHYHHLTCLDLLEVHDDYIEEFLLDTKTSLPFNIKVYVYYEAIRRITCDFQRTETRINCSKMNCVYSSRDSFRPSKHFKKYFLRIDT